METTLVIVCAGATKMIGGNGGMSGALLRKLNTITGSLPSGVSVTAAWMSSWSAR